MRPTRLPPALTEGGASRPRRLSRHDRARRPRPADRLRRDRADRPRPRPRPRRRRDPLAGQRLRPGRRRDAPAVRQALRRARRRADLRRRRHRLPDRLRALRRRPVDAPAHRGPRRAGRRGRRPDERHDGGARPAQGPRRAGSTKSGSFGGVVAGGGMALGPWLGGLLADHANWRWIFYVNLPVGIAVLAASAVVLRLPRRPAVRRAVDYPGAALAAAFSGSLLLVTDWGGKTYAWSSPVVVGLLAATAATLALFLWRQSRAAGTGASALPVPHPAAAPGLRHPGLIRRRHDVRHLLRLVYLQIARGVSSSSAGLYLLPMAAGMTAVGLLSGPLAARGWSARTFTVSGTATAALAFGLLATRRPGHLPLADPSRTPAGRRRVRPADRAAHPAGPGLRPAPPAGGRDDGHPLLPDPRERARHRPVRHGPAPPLRGERPRRRHHGPARPTGAPHAAGVRAFVDATDTVFLCGAGSDVGGRSRWLGVFPSPGW